MGLKLTAAKDHLQDWMKVVPRDPKPEHGKRSTYVRGCRCELCCAANTAYGIELKARRRRGDKIQPPLASIASVTSIRGAKPPTPAPARDPDEQGPNELSVIKEMKGLSATTKRPGLVQSIIAMAKILDNDAAVTTHPSAQRRLEEGLDKLWGASVKRKGTLSEVAAMTNREAPKAAKAK
jgi:hypothetical protein